MPTLERSGLRRPWFAALALATLGLPSFAGGADLARGRKVYAAACLECHGPAGRGDGPKAKRMGFRPRDFVLGAFKCRCTASGQLPSDDDLRRSVARGLPGTAMQSHEKSLSPEEIAAVVEFVKTLAPRFAAESPGACLAIPPAPPLSEAPVAEGKQLYRLLQCWKCHGKSGRGDGPAAADLKDDWGHPIKAYNFTVLKKFKCGGSDAELFRTLHTGMNGSPMPSYAAALGFTRDGAADLGPLESYFGPAGAAELRAYVERQPDRAALAAMSERQRAEVVERRTWALVRYIRSLLGPGR